MGKNWKEWLQAHSFSSKAEVTIEIGSLRQDQYIAIARKILLAMNLEISAVGSNGIVAHKKMNWATWGSDFRLKVSDKEVHIKSSTSGQLLDWGKNKSLVLTFLVNP